MAFAAFVFDILARVEAKTARSSAQNRKKEETPKL
jgi:hypothetical protein